MQTMKLTNILLSVLVSLSVTGLPVVAKGKNADAKGAAASPATSEKKADKAASADKAPAAELKVSVANASSSVKQGDKATVAVKTEPGANCKITVKLKSGVSSNADLQPQKADATGNASWTWTIAKNTSPGQISFDVDCTLKRKKASTSGTITVEAAAAAATEKAGGKKNEKSDKGQKKK
jgi:hypothetical protein